MADEVKTDDAEKAYAAAAAELKPVKTAKPETTVEPTSKAPVEPKADVVANAAEAPKPAAAAKPAKAAEAAKPATGARPVAKKPVKAAPAKAKNKPAKAAPKIEKKPARKRVAAKVLPVPARIKAKIANKAAATKAVVPTKPVVTTSKETIMSKNTTTDFALPIAEAFGEFQNRATDAYSKGTAALTEATEFAKGNVEAFVESTKIFAAGVQDMSKSYVEEAKSAYATVTGDVKELAAVKSPTELFQLQGKIARRNFDAMIANSSKNTDAFVKLATEAFAPITGRVNLAAEKLAKVA